MMNSTSHILNKDRSINYKIPEPLLQALVGLAPPISWISGVESRATLRLYELLCEGSHAANHVFMYFRASVCTWAMVASTLAALVPRSEQWYPSPTTTGCVGVDWTFRPSADSVTSLHGSPRDQMFNIKDRTQKTVNDVRCPLATKSLSTLTSQPW